MLAMLVLHINHHHLWHRTAEHTMFCPVVLLIPSSPVFQPEPLLERERERERGREREREREGERLLTRIESVNVYIIQQDHVIIY